MAKTTKKKKAVKAGKKPTRAERSKLNKEKHAREQAAREAERLRKKTAAKAAAEAPEVTPYPQAGRKVTEFEEAMERKIVGDTPGAAVPREDVPAEPPDFDVKVIAQVCQIPFDLWSVSQGVDGLKLTDAEARLMAKPAKQLLDHYLPQIPVIAWAWISLAVVSYSSMKSRLMLIQQLKQAKASLRTPTTEASPPLPGQGQGGPPLSVASPESFPTMAQIKKGAA